MLGFRAFFPLVSLLYLLHSWSIWTSTERVRMGKTYPVVFIMCFIVSSYKFYMYVKGLTYFTSFFGSPCVILPHRIILAILGWRAPSSPSTEMNWLMACTYEEIGSSICCVAGDREDLNVSLSQPLFLI